MNRPQKNKNPFALMDISPDPWKGLVGKAPDGFLIFDNAANGTRAGFINLVNAYLKRGLDTIEKIFPVYAPTGHGTNDPEAYIKSVVNQTGIPRNKKLSSAKEIETVGRAIIKHEEGNFWVNSKDFETGFKAAMSTSNWVKTNPGLFTGGAILSALIILLIIWQA